MVNKLCVKRLVNHSVASAFVDSALVDECHLLTCLIGKRLTWIHKTLSLNSCHNSFCYRSLGGVLNVIVDVLVVSQHP